VYLVLVLNKRGKEGKTFVTISASHKIFLDVEKKRQRPTDFLLTILLRSSLEIKKAVRHRYSPFAKKCGLAKFLGEGIDEQLLYFIHIRTW